MAVTTGYRLFMGGTSTEAASRDVCGLIEPTGAPSLEARSVVVSRRARPSNRFGL